VIDIQELERRMRPGAWSHEGFLGPSERLEDVLRVDRQTLEELELEPGQLADTLDCLLSARDAGALVDGRFEVLMMPTAGWQECPWSPTQLFGGGEPCATGSADWGIRDRQRGLEMREPELITHLIREHGFFEGFESPYRVDPRALAELRRRQGLEDPRQSLSRLFSRSSRSAARARRVFQENCCSVTPLSAGRPGRAQNKPVSLPAP
jgi:hypothetical protein